MGDETGIGLLPNLLRFKSVDGDPLGLLILIFNSSLLHSFPSLLSSRLFREAISKQYLDWYINVSHDDFGK